MDRYATPPITIPRYDIVTYWMGWGLLDFFKIYFFYNFLAINSWPATEGWILSEVFISSRLPSQYHLLWRWCVCIYSWNMKRLRLSTFCNCSSILPVWDHADCGSHATPFGVSPKPVRTGAISRKAYRCAIALFWASLYELRIFLTNDDYGRGLKGYIQMIDDNNVWF